MHRSCIQSFSACVADVTSLGVMLYLAHNVHGNGARPFYAYLGRHQLNSNLKNQSVYRFFAEQMLEMYPPEELDLRIPECVPNGNRMASEDVKRITRHLAGDQRYLMVTSLKWCQLIYRYYQYISDRFSIVCCPPAYRDKSGYLIYASDRLKPNGERCQHEIMTIASLFGFHCGSMA